MDDKLLNMFDKRITYLEDILSKRSAHQIYLTTEEVMKITGLAKQTIYQFTSQNRIPYRKLGRALRFDRKEIEKWIEDRIQNNNRAK